MARFSIGGIVAALAATLAACGGATGPTYPPLAGTYAVLFTGNITPSGYAPQALPSQAGTVTLTNADRAGDFTGSYIEGGQAGTIAGSEHIDGGINILQFGNPNQTPLEALELLQQELPFCNVAEAASVPMSGTITNRTLSLSGGMLLPCNWLVGNQNVTLTTSISIVISGTRN